MHLNWLIVDQRLDGAPRLAVRVGLEAESDSSANVMLETFAPAFTTLGAVHRLPVGKHNGGFAERVVEGKFTAPISAARLLGVGARCVEARTT